MVAASLPATSALAVIVSVVLVASAVLTWLPKSTSSAATTVTSRDRSDVPAASVDYEGLSEIVASLDEGTPSSSFSKREQIFRDKYMYYPAGARPADCWPFPYANKHTNSLCYNGALTQCMALTYRDYTMTLDSIYDEIIDKMGEAAATKGGHEMDGGKRTIWPKTLMEYFAEEHGLKWNKIEEGTDGKTALQQIKDALLQDHVVVFGDGKWEPTPMTFYEDDSGVRTRQCLNGHTIMFYKYEDDAFWAKDTGVGPKIRYPEHGGVIDMESFAAKTGDGYIGIFEFYTDEPQRPKFPNIPDSMLYDETDSQSQQASSRSAVVARPTIRFDSEPSPGFSLASESITVGSLGSPFSSLGGSPSADGRDDRDEVVRQACLGTSPVAGEVPGGWVVRALRSCGWDVPDDVTPTELYARCCTTDSLADPVLSSLEPGMVVASPQVASDDPSERVLGHCGVYVGGGTVVHERGGVVEEVPVGEFMGTYGGVVAVGWGSPGQVDWSERAIASEDASTSVAVVGSSPVSAGIGISEDDIRSAISQAASMMPVVGGATATLVGSWASDDGSVGVLGYRLTSDGAETSSGVTVVLPRGKAPVAMESRLVVADAATAYDTADGEYVPMLSAQGGGTAADAFVGDFDYMTPEEYLTPFLDPETAIV